MTDNPTIKYWKCPFCGHENRMVDMFCENCHKHR